MLQFFLQELRIATCCFGPMGEGTADTIFGLRDDGDCPTVSTGPCVWVSCTQ